MKDVPRAEAAPEVAVFERPVKMKAAIITSEIVSYPAAVMFHVRSIGMAGRIVNLAQWRAHLLERLAQQIAATGDPVLKALRSELAAYPMADPGPTPTGDFSGVVVPLQLRTETGVLSFISTTTIFGSPVDVTLQELAVESFFPADAATAQALTALAGRAG